MRFKLGCQVTVSAYTEIEASSLEDAIREAKGREIVIGGPHSGTDATEQWIIEDADGAACNIHEF